MADSVNRIEALFAEALLYSTAVERAAFLDRACPNDARLRSRVEALLNAHDGAGSFMSSSTAGPVDEAPGLEAVAPRRQSGNGGEGPPSETVGAVIDRYKLLQRI